MSALPCQHGPQLIFFFTSPPQISRAPFQWRTRARIRAGRNSLSTPSTTRSLIGLTGRLVRRLLVFCVDFCFFCVGILCQLRQQVV